MSARARARLPWSTRHLLRGPLQPSRLHRGHVSGVFSVKLVSAQESSRAVSGIQTRLRSVLRVKNRSTSAEFPGRDYLCVLMSDSVAAILLLSQARAKASAPTVCYSPTAVANNYKLRKLVANIQLAKIGFVHSGSIIVSNTPTY
ncbi:hypothetical protein MN608_03960 [Microdochium nivale]|nr:hypothetical protein MN608_03960 [Microdochium nivale]